MYDNGWYVYTSSICVILTFDVFRWTESNHDSKVKLYDVYVFRFTNRYCRSISLTSHLFAFPTCNVSLSMCVYSYLLIYVLFSLQVIGKLEKKLSVVQRESFPHVCPTVDEACEVPVEHLTLSPKFEVTIYCFYLLQNIAFSKCLFQRKNALNAKTH